MSNLEILNSSAITDVLTLLVINYSYKLRRSHDFYIAQRTGLVASPYLSHGHVLSDSLGARALHFPMVQCRK